MTARSAKGNVYRADGVYRFDGGFYVRTNSRTMVAGRGLHYRFSDGRPWYAIGGLDACVFQIGKTWRACTVRSPSEHWIVKDEYGCPVRFRLPQRAAAYLITNAGK